MVKSHLGESGQIGYSRKKIGEVGLRTYFFEPPSPLIPLEILGFLLHPQISIQNKASPLETPQNFVAPLGNFKP